MPVTFRLLPGAVLTACLLSGTARAQQPADDAAPKPPRVPSPGAPRAVEPVSPGTSVDGQGAPVTLSPETLAAIREIVRQERAAQPPPPSGQGPAYGPVPSQQAPVVYQAPPPVYQAPVTPVVLVQQKSKLHQAVGALGARMASIGAPVVSQAFIQEQPVQTVTYTTQARVKHHRLQAALPTVTPVQPVTAQYVQVPAAPPVQASLQAPRK